VVSLGVTVNNMEQSISISWKSVGNTADEVALTELVSSGRLFTIDSALLSETVLYLYTVSMYRVALKLITSYNVI